MAWNDPGRNDDPWSRGGGQAPPDLDEAFRKLQARLSRLFGGGGGSSGGKMGLNWRSVLIGLAVLLAAYGIWGVYQLDEQERGVIFRFGKVQPEPKLPGINWRPPLIDQLERVNITVVDSHNHNALMLTEDENIVDVSLTVQFRRTDPIDYVVMVRDPRQALEDATESALRHVVGGSKMDLVLTEGRLAMGQEVEERIQRYLDVYGTGIEVVTVNIDESAPPAQVQEAFDDVQKAKEDKVREENLADAYWESEIPKARGEASKAVQEAEAYRDQVVAEATGEAERFLKLLAEYKLAPEVTRDRLYIDAWKSVLEQSSKVIVDVGDDNIMILPLDRQGTSVSDDDEMRNAVSAASQGR
ncbi:MAG: FtsH protease activity modulator HflK [Gammaproteobacteria bacterium]|nr:FtsH protease activity modulator HflK [Gammaproteobacteria bacterium]MXY56060.1 FtsH protease activity modulator HflK [Gammaproteobacteria bacterium]MYF28486.1 FtsH protease activity modulator HflK [Gammaproteobacteria bacterium]MYK46904.1 FtsH protease activity modulator HflK [Gammaproteobacteria bacterium]